MVRTRGSSKRKLSDIEKPKKKTQKKGKKGKGKHPQEDTESEEEKREFIARAKGKGSKLDVADCLILRDCNDFLRQRWVGDTHFSIS